MKDEIVEGFLSSKQAKEKAREELALLLDQKDPLFASFSEADIGEPVLVRNLFGDPSYWMVPILNLGKTIGFARILGNGRIAHIGTFIRTLKEIDAAPINVTGISEIEARKIAKKNINSNQGESITDPVFVHDGPIGREAWFVEVKKNDKPESWLFITSSGMYKRQAGNMIDDIIDLFG